MKKLAIVFAVGTAALMGGSAAYAAEPAVKAKPSTHAAQTSTDISAQHRHYHGRHHHWGHHHWGHRHWGHHHHRPYYNSYGYYAPRAYGYYGPRHYGPRYYGGGPGVTFSFGGGSW